MKQNERKTGGSFTYTVAVRCLAAGFVLYSLWEIVNGYLKGGEEAPSLMLLLLSILVLGGGGIFIAVMAWKEWKKGGRPAEEPTEEAQLPEQNGE